MVSQISNYRVVVRRHWEHVHLQVFVSQSFIFIKHHTHVVFEISHTLLIKVTVLTCRISKWLDNPFIWFILTFYLMPLSGKHSLIPKIERETLIIIICFKSYRVLLDWQYRKRIAQVLFQQMRSLPPITHDQRITFKDLTSRPTIACTNEFNIAFYFWILFEGSHFTIITKIYIWLFF